MTCIIQIPQGTQFGAWTVEGMVPKTSSRTLFICRCACGVTKQVESNKLRKGRSKSCGCKKNEYIGVRARTHGESVGGMTPEFRIYFNAKARCETVTNAAYPNYGGRGIEFRFHSIVEFLDVLGRRPSAQHSVDRINNNGHYEKGNVRWATKSEQARNRRSNVLVTYKNETKIATEWAEIFNIGVSKAIKRLGRGWCFGCSFNDAAVRCIHINQADVVTA